MNPDLIDRALAEPFDGVDLVGLGPRTRGKVRDLYRRDGELIIVTTDRLSAFDVVLGTVPYKGQVLNELAVFWFDATADIVANHLLSMPDPNVVVARACRALPVEVIVRGFITGVTDTSLWTRYAAGEREIYGLAFPEGLSKNARLPAPVITPTTKAEAGAHDDRLTSAEVVGSGRVDEATWEEVTAAALALFARGQEIAADAGLVLVDTKYEFGVDDSGELRLIDEVHTPDSSRFWLADSYESRVAAGEEPDNADKELIRLAYTAMGYDGDGPPPPLPDTLARTAAARYIDVFERLTGSPFVPAARPAPARIAEALGVAA